MRERKLVELDPEWTVALIFECGHVQHACCKGCLDEDCPICNPEINE